MSRIVFLLCILSIQVNCNQWNYGHLGPDIWSDYYPSCSGQFQSPINILTACTTYKKLTSFQYSTTDNEQHYFTLINNGHTIIGTLSNDYKQSPIRLIGGGLNGTFEFVNFHIHWGENYKSGSEHQINGIKYTGEIHFVYVNPQTSQMAVLGIFMQSHLDNNTKHFNENDQTHYEWQRYFNISHSLRSENDSIIFNTNYKSLMGDNLDQFWRYQGSLTTPPCTEGVLWTVFKQPIAFRESQFKMFRDNVYFEDYRGPQPLYNRIVYRNFPNETVSSVPDYNNCLLDIEKMNIKDKTKFFGGINCSTSSFFVLLIVFNLIFICIGIAFWKVRYSLWRKKFE